MRYKLLLLLIIPAFGILNESNIAQTFNWTSYSTGIGVVAGGVDSKGIDKDAMGNIYIAGYFNHTIIFDEDTLTSIGGTGDIFIAKYNSSGTLQWVRQAGGIWHDYGLDIAVDDNGNCYVTGTFWGTAYFGTDSLIGGVDYTFIAKYNTNGDFQWAAKADIFDDSNLEAKYFTRRIAVNNNEEVYLTGGFRLTAYFYNAGEYSSVDTLTSTSTQVTDIFTICYNSGGILQWVKSAGGTGVKEAGRDIAIDNLGNCLITGEFTGTINFGDQSLVCEGDGNIFIARYHPSGALTFLKSIGGSSFVDARSISIDASNNIYLTGTFVDSLMMGQDVLDYPKNGGVYLAKFDQNASPIWLRGPVRTDPSTNISFYNVDVSPSGQCYVTGSYAGTVIFGNDTLFGGWHMLTTHYTANGDVVWGRQAGNTAASIPFDIRVENDDYCYVTGAYAYYDVFGTDTIGEGPGVFVTKFFTEGTVDVENSSPVTESYFLEQNYPNPFNPNTTIQYELSTTVYVKIIIYNLLGQKVKTLVNTQQTAGNYKAIWNGENNLGEPVASGVYFYRLTMKGLAKSENRFSQTKKMLLLR